MNDTVHIYRDHAGLWRWRRVARNGRTISDSSESYTRRRDAVKAAHRANDSIVPFDQYTVTDQRGAA